MSVENSQSKGLFFSSRDFTREVKVPPASSDLGKANIASGAPTVTILFISLSATQYNLESEWAEVQTKLKTMLNACGLSA